MLNLAEEGNVGVPKQEEKERWVLGEDLLLPLSLAGQEESQKGSFDGGFLLVSRVSLVASVTGAAPGCPALDPSLDTILRFLEMSPKRLAP